MYLHTHTLHTLHTIHKHTHIYTHIYTHYTHYTHTHTTHTVYMQLRDQDGSLFMLTLKIYLMENVKVMIIMTGHHMMR